MVAAKRDGAGLFDIALGVGVPCAKCVRNPGQARVRSVVAALAGALGLEEKDTALEDNWRPAEVE